MAYQIAEKYLSGELSRGSQRNGSREFLVFNVETPTTSTEASVLAAVQAAAPATFDDLPIQSVAVKQIANGVWSGTVTYAPAEANPPSEYEGFLTTFSTNGGSETVYLAKDQGRLSLVNENPLECPDHGLQIGVNADGSIEGVSIVVPEFEFTETHYFARAAVDADYVKTLRDLTGSVNAAEFRNFEAGTVLFLGASGGVRQDRDDWAISFSFSVSPNRSFTVAEILGDPAAPFGTNYIPKRGHEYLWLAYEKSTDYTGGNGVTTTRPNAAYVSRVYDEVDFAALGIGGATG